MVRTQTNKRKPSVFLDLDASHDPTSSPAASDTPLKKLRVSELKELLELPGLETTGRKIDLLARLEAAEEPQSTAGQDSAGAAALPSASSKVAAAAEPPAQQAPAPVAEDGFDIDAFLAGSSTTQAASAPQQAAAQGWDGQTLTIVGFAVEESGSIKCLDPAFPSEFRQRSNEQEFVSTKDKPGAHSVHQAHRVELLWRRALALLLHTRW